MIRRIDFCNIINIIKKYLLFFIIFCIALSARMYAISQKSTFHFDDPASIICTTPNNLDENGKPIKESWAGFYFKYGHDYNSLELKKMLFETKSDLQSLKNDIIQIRKNRLDRDHSNFYYTFLRIWNCGLDYSNPHSIMHRDCSLNLLFFPISFFFMYKLLSLIRKEKSFIALGLLICFLSTGSVSCGLLIREYPLMETFMIFLMYFFIKFYKIIISDDAYNMTNKTKVFYAMCIAASMLSSYLSLIMLIFIVGILTFKAIKHNKLNILKDIGIMLLGSIFLAEIFYPKLFISIIQTSHPEIIYQNLSPIRYLIFKNFGPYLINFLMKYVYYFAFIYIIVYFLYFMGIPLLDKERKFDKQEVTIITLVLSITFLWAYVSVAVAPFQEDIAVRYVIACFVLLGILTTVLTFILNRYLRTALVTLFVVCTFVSFTPIRNTQNAFFSFIGDTVYFDTFGWLNINNYIHGDTHDRNVVTVDRNWIWPNFLIYMPNNITVRFEENIPDENYDWNDYVLINREDVSIVNRD